MESEKVKEVKQALEHCREKETCNGCPEYDNKPRIDWFECNKILLQKTINLINELESENERLTEERDLFKKQFNELEPRFFHLREENKELKDRIALLEKDNELLRNAKVVYETVDYCYEDLKKAEKRIAELETENETKTDTITDLLKKQEFYEKEKLKQFAERLKEKTRVIVSYYADHADKSFNGISEKGIDETLEEFLK